MEAINRVVLTCDELIAEVKEGLYALDNGDQTQVLQSFDRIMNCYEKVEITVLLVGGYREQGNIKAWLRRIKRELDDAKETIDIEQYKRTKEMLEGYLLPVLKRLREKIRYVPFE